jgi:hypothetical protein
MIDISCSYNEIASPNSKVFKPLTWEEISWNQKISNSARTKPTVLCASQTYFLYVYLVFYVTGVEPTKATYSLLDKTWYPFYQTSCEIVKPIFFGLRDCYLTYAGPHKIHTRAGFVPRSLDSVILNETIEVKAYFSLNFIFLLKIKQALNVVFLFFHSSDMWISLCLENVLSQVSLYECNHHSFCSTWHNIFVGIVCGSTLLGYLL